MKLYRLLLIFVCGSVLSTGCALKAPLVTEALPITKIRGVSPAKTPVRPVPRASPSPVATPAPLATPAQPSSGALDVAQEQEATAANAIVGTQTYYFSGSNKLPPLAKALQIQEMNFRSLLTDPSDQSEDARKNGALVDQCPNGRSNLDFIQSVAVGVRHKNEKDTEAVVIATYTQTQTGLCGFHLTPTNFDMKDYASDYTFVIQVTGTLPTAPLSISGYYTAQDYEGF